MWRDAGAITVMIVWLSILTPLAYGQDDNAGPPGGNLDVFNPLSSKSLFLSIVLLASGFLFFAGQIFSRLPSSLSQFEEAVGHWRGRRSSDSQSLVDCFQNEAAVEAPGEGAEVAREMFGRDGAVRGQEAVFDIGEHGICPAEGGVSGGGATGAGDVALVGDARLVSNATKPLPAVADDSGSGFDAGA